MAAPGEVADDEHLLFDLHAAEPVLWACFWGLLSAASLPSGAIVGITCLPSEKVRAAMMAFGAGALLLAVTIELFGHAVFENEDDKDYQRKVIGVMVAASISGGWVFQKVNSILNSKGAFFRSWAYTETWLFRAVVDGARDMPLPTSSSLAVASYHFNKTRFVGGAPKFDNDSMESDGTDVELARSNPNMSESNGNFSTSHGIDTHGVDVQPLLGVQASDISNTSLPRADTDNAGQLKWEDQNSSLQNSSLDGTKKARSHTPVTKHVGFRDPSLSQDSRDHRGVRVNSLNSLMDRSTLQAEKSRIMRQSFDRYSHHSNDETGEVVDHSKQQALLIWAGLLIDAIPESFVIGFMVAKNDTSPLVFIVGVFLSNFPEAMSSSGTMKAAGMDSFTIMMLWCLTFVLTGIGAMIGAAVIPSDADQEFDYVIYAIEGVAAGAMLSVIAQAMLPEAFHQGGEITGMACLAGFLAGLLVILIPL